MAVPGRIVTLINRLMHKQKKAYQPERIRLCFRVFAEINAR